MRQGLKRVAHRRDDALTGVRWDRLEHLLAAYYRHAGYRVTHVGTGASARRFDSGVDLKLQRDGRVVLVQVKHWNAYKVPHNEVHQLIGLMVNGRADAAILVTSGEFTKAAIEVATRNGLVQLIDGDELGVMLKPHSMRCRLRSTLPDVWPNTSGTLLACRDVWRPAAQPCDGKIQAVSCICSLT